VGFLVIPRGRDTSQEIETSRGKAAHSCRNALQALLDFSIARLGAVFCCWMVE